jgi:hypothetical protein
MQLKQEGKSDSLTMLRDMLFELMQPFGEVRIQAERLKVIMRPRSLTSHMWHLPKPCPGTAFMIMPESQVEGRPGKRRQGTLA